MQFYRDLYVSPEIKHPEHIKWRLRHNAGSLSLYVITLCDESLSGKEAFPHGVSDFEGQEKCESQELISPAGSGSLQGQLLMFHCANLQQPYEKKHCPMIIGIAQGRMAALELVRRIVQECVEKTGGADLVPFLAKRDARIHWTPPLVPEKIISSGQGVHSPWKGGGK